MGIGSAPGIYDRLVVVGFITVGLRSALCALIGGLGLIPISTCISGD